MHFHASAIVAFAAAVYAFPNAAEPKGHKWMAPGPGDVRSPCPGMNSLANHGFINRSGKNLTIDNILPGLMEGLAIAPDFTNAIGGSALLSTQNPAAGVFTLKDIRMHNFPIEHDASLSRLDRYFGSDWKFNQQNWNMVLRHFKGDKFATVDTAAKAKYSRLNNSEATNPKLQYGPREFIFSYGETALYLQTMGMSPLPNTKAEVEYVKVLFEQERLPYKEGWKPSSLPITLASLAAMANNLVMASGEEAPEGIQITEDTFKDVFSASSTIGGIVFPPSRK